MKKLASKKQIKKLREELVKKASEIVDDNGNQVFSKEWLEKYILNNKK